MMLPQPFEWAGARCAPATGEDAMADESHAFACRRVLPGHPALRGNLEGLRQCDPGISFVRFVTFVVKRKIGVCPTPS
jgi:hypothetical protein